jgi:hypothetical protein
MYEVRDYHYRRDLFDEYKQWAEKAVPILKKQHPDPGGYHQLLSRFMEEMD